MLGYSLESGGRMRHPLMLLFPSYVFFCGSEDDRYQAVSTNRLCQVIDIPDQSQLKTELDAVLRALKANLVPGSCPLPRDGNRCRIKSGPLTGAEGILTRTAGSQPQLILPVCQATTILRRQRQLQLQIVRGTALVQALC
jgi:hypothetical protein